ncbi:MAG: UTP--glucose-1-phosphate uridylyltransferase [Anaerolineae bacterium]|nr:UTP--glucose-1-phosphate uridylyltransferase [Anaerolineae bacterium]
MKITKAVVTVAGRGQRALPLQTLIDRDGAEKSVLGILIEEVQRAGVEEIGLVVRSGDEGALTAVAGNHAAHLHFIPQPEPLGYGHALLCARDFVADMPFLHLVGDHIYVSRGDEGCARQLVQIAAQEECTVSAVQATREHLLPYFGVVGGRPLPNRAHLYRVDTVMEKPTPTEAEQQLIVPGLRAGHYLCFFGMHVLTPGVMEILGRLLAAAQTPNRVTLSQALHELAQGEQVLALAKQDWRYDLGARYGLMTAQMALALHGRDRDQVLTQLLELLAGQQSGNS